jgi:hypothetical protein
MTRFFAPPRPQREKIEQFQAVWPFPFGVQGRKWPKLRIAELIEEVIPYQAYRFYETSSFPQVPDGIYTVFVSYVLPGNAITTTPATSIDILFPPPSGAGGPGSSFREGEDNSNGTSTGSND